MNLSKELFWDVDYNSLNFEQHARFIIERVVTRGMLSDLRQILDYYDHRRIADEATEIRSLDKKSLYFLSSILSIPVQNFRCYTQIQSKEAHWNY